MKVAIVSCGLLDSMMPLVRYLGQKVTIDLYVAVHGQQYQETITSFDLSNTPSGLVDEKTTEALLGKGLVGYGRSRPDQVRIYLFRYPNLKMFSWQNFRLHQQFAGILNQGKYDVIHFNGYRGGLMLLYPMLRKKTGKVWTIHDPVQHSGEVKWQTQLGYHLFRWLKTHFILHNQSQQPDFIKNYQISPQRCHYVNFGPLEVFKIFKNGKAAQPQPASVLFYGRISPYKGVEYLIEAARMARQHIPGLKVVIAGKPNYPVDLASLKADSTFTVLDRFLQNAELVHLIESCQLVVCPYTDATQSGVIMTAYAFHKPVLATSVGGIPEVVQDGKTGRLVPPRDAPALAEALVEILSDEQNLQKMIDQLSQKVDTGHLSWVKISERTLAVYQQAMR